MNTVEETFAKRLLDIEAVKLRPAQPFVWASGWHSPIYCDNRKTLSYPQLRTYVKQELARLVRTHFPQSEVVAGVATGAIPQGALVSDLLDMPFLYVRSKPKDHGMANLIEGDLRRGQVVVVVEDLISTGGSSLKAVEALREAGAEVTGMVASFTYGFPVAAQAFADAGVQLFTLSNYEAVLSVALRTGYVQESQLPVLREWRHDPANWNR